MRSQHILLVDNDAKYRKRHYKKPDSTVVGGQAPTRITKHEEMELQTGGSKCSSKLINE